MISRPIARYGYPASVVLLLAAIGLVGGFVALTVVPELGSLLGGTPVTPATTPSPSATPALTLPMAFGPNGIAMSPGADCAACHLDSSGAVTTRAIPQLAHPLEGWKDCTACHADDRLVETAPGHSGLHKSDCLACHKVPSAEGSAPPRPHHLPTQATCVSCHGSKVPLPTDMAGRTNCWICHSGREYDDLFNGPARTLQPPPGVAPGG
jgi:hypothetical protein